MRSHKACVMNLITYNGAYSLFPRATFDEGRSLVCCTRSMDHEQAIEKYEKRGWEIQKNITEQEQEAINSSFRVEDRWIGDEKTFPWYIRQVVQLKRTSLFAISDFLSPSGRKPWCLQDLNKLRRCRDLKFTIIEALVKGEGQPK